jgi:hypothetical protein
VWKQSRLKLSKTVSAQVFKQQSITQLQLLTSMEMRQAGKAEFSDDFTRWKIALRAHFLGKEVYARNC